MNKSLKLKHLLIKSTGKLMLCSLEYKMQEPEFLTQAHHHEEERELSLMKKKVEWLSDKVEDMENRSQRINLHFSGFREGIEEGNCTKFIQTDLILFPSASPPQIKCACCS